MLTHGPLPSLALGPVSTPVTPSGFNPTRRPSLRLGHDFGAPNRVRAARLVNRVVLGGALGALGGCAVVMGVVGHWGAVTVSLAVLLVTLVAFPRVLERFTPSGLARTAPLLSVSLSTVLDDTNRSVLTLKELEEEMGLGALGAAVTIATREFDDLVAREQEVLAKESDASLVKHQWELVLSDALELRTALDRLAMSAERVRRTSCEPVSTSAVSSLPYLTGLRDSLEMIRAGRHYFDGAVRDL